MEKNKEIVLKDELKIVYADLENLPFTINADAISILQKSKDFDKLKESLSEFENKFLVEVANETIDQGGKLVKAFSNESTRAAEVSRRCSSNVNYAAIQKAKDSKKEEIDNLKLVLELNERRFEAAKYKVRLLEIIAGD